MGTDNKASLKIGLGISVHSLISEEELKPISKGLRENNIALEHIYLPSEPKASLDWFDPVIALYISSETFRSIVQNGLYDVFKFYFLSICKIVENRKYIRLQSSKTEERKGSITFVVNTPEKASVYFKYEGMITDADKSNAFDCLKTAIKNLKLDTDKQNMSIGDFDKELNIWKVKTVKEIFEEIRRAKNTNPENT